MDRINKLKEFLKKQPDDSFLQHALALEYVKIGNEREAKLLFERILENDALYIGSYYHLAKLFERIGDEQGAITVYQNGIIVAEKIGDKHSKNELQMALDELIV